MLKNWKLITCVAALFAIVSSQVPALGDSRYSAPEPATPDKAICFALYTVSGNVLKLTAHMYPLEKLPDYDKSTKATLQIKRPDGQWTIADESSIAIPGYVASFRVEDWDDSRSAEYRVNYGSANYEGFIRANPKDKDTVIVAFFTGNGPNRGDIGPVLKKNVAEGVASLDPDILCFTGDQYYGKNNEYRGWIDFGETYGDIMRNRPTITMPDDHDVSQGNIWGEGGKKPTKENPGGYVFSAERVNQVHAAQCGHLPDPYDSTPIARGITTYYTHYKWGGLSFAIVSDRMFKSAPLESNVDNPDAVLLGERQLKFLADWNTDWQGVDAKFVVSQTPFVSGMSLSPVMDKPSLDSNGFPKVGRDRAIRTWRKSYAVHLNGDQHLPYAGFYGIDEYRDSGFSFCCPAIRNSVCVRQIRPPVGQKEIEGDYTDGLGNKFTISACGNPKPILPENQRSEGFAAIRVNKKTGNMVCDVYAGYKPLKFDKDKKLIEGRQLRGGFPVSLHLYDNFASSSKWQLPQIDVSGAENPLVKVTDAKTGELVSIVRIVGTSFAPKVLKQGLYNITVTHGSKSQAFENVKATQEPGKPLQCDFQR